MSTYTKQFPNQQQVQQPQAPPDARDDNNNATLSAKGRFISRMKLWLYKEKGEHIYDHVLMEMG